MPNWVANKLVITGEDKYLNALREQVSQPYHTHHYDFMSNSIGHREVEGQFLLWNIVRPTNLEAYYEYEKNMEKAEARKTNNSPDVSKEEILDKLNEAISNFTPEAFAESAQQLQRELVSGQDWYHWNIREWGTKWEIDEAHLFQRTGELKYEFSTAWSPPIPALSKLASQYPKLVITIRFIDEGHMFAGEVHWRNGFVEFEADIDINHGLIEEMYGECYSCNDEVKDDPDYEESRKSLRCEEFNKPVEIEEMF